LILIIAMMVSTVTVVATSSIAVAAGIFVALFLIGLLAGKELLGTSPNNRARYVSKCLTIGIIPLLLGFVIIVGMKVAEILA
jgi:hypothetical protein